LIVKKSNKVDYVDDASPEKHLKTTALFGLARFASRSPFYTCTAATENDHGYAEATPLPPETPWRSRSLDASCCQY
jgi:hypothetical protein